MSTHRTDPKAMGAHPASVSLGDEFSRMLREQPGFLSGVTGGRLVPEGDVVPPIVIDHDPGAGVDHGRGITLVAMSYEEKRGSFEAGYVLISPGGGFSSDVELKGFLVGDSAVIEDVVSTTDTENSRPLGSDVVRYQASVLDGVVTDTSLVSNPTERKSIDVGMAGGRFYAFSAKSSTLLDASSMDPVQVADLRKAIGESDSGLVWTAVDVAPSIGNGSRIADAEVLGDIDYDDNGTEVGRMYAVRRVSTDFKAEIADRFVADNAPMLGEAAAGFMRGGDVFVDPVVHDASLLDVRDDGHRARVAMFVPHDGPDEVGLRPNEVAGIYEIVPGMHPRLAGVELRAERFAEVDGVVVKTHDSVSRVHEGEPAVIEEKRPTGQVVLSAEGGRLYAVQDNHYGERPGMGHDEVRISEVKGGLDGVTVRDLLKKVASKDEVMDWNTAVLGSIGAGPVSVGVLVSHDAQRVARLRLEEIDGAVAAFRKDEGHVSGLMAQAVGVKREGEPVKSTGPASIEAPGIMDRMKSLLSIGQDGR